MFDFDRFILSLDQYPQPYYSDCWNCLQIHIVLYNVGTIYCSCKSCSYTAWYIHTCETLGSLLQNKINWTKGFCSCLPNCLEQSANRTFGSSQQWQFPNFQNETENTWLIFLNQGKVRCPSCIWGTNVPVFGAIAFLPCGFLSKAHLKSISSDSNSLLAGL